MITDNDSTKLHVVWVDLTRSTYVTELPKTITRRSRRTRFDSLARLSEAATSGAVADWDTVIFDLDFPEEVDLAAIGELKLSVLSSCPILLMTVQHSESLAIWALRNRFFDYFVKPADALSLDACFDRLESIKIPRGIQPSRKIIQTISNPSPKLPAARKAEVQITKAIRFVENNFAGDLKNQEVADACGMTEFRFSRAFKERYGVRFREYVIYFRLREARRLLANAEVSVTEVAYSVGFNDPSYFTRVFRKNFGKNPSAYVGVPADAEDIPFLKHLNFREK